MSWSVVLLKMAWVELSFALELQTNRSRLNHLKHWGVTLSVNQKTKLRGFHKLGGLPPLKETFVVSPNSFVQQGVGSIIFMSWSVVLLKMAWVEFSFAVELQTNKIMLNYLWYWGVTLWVNQRTKLRGFHSIISACSWWPGQSSILLLMDLQLLRIELAWSGMWLFLHTEEQIGRASCRERVCLYV